MSEHDDETKAGADDISDAIDAIGRAGKEFTETVARRSDIERLEQQVAERTGCRYDASHFNGRWEGLIAEQTNILVDNQNENAQSVLGKIDEETKIITRKQDQNTQSTHDRIDELDQSMDGRFPSKKDVTNLRTTIDDLQKHSEALAKKPEGPKNDNEGIAAATVAIQETREEVAATRKTVGVLALIALAIPVTFAFTFFEAIIGTFSVGGITLPTIKFVAINQPVNGNVLTAETIDGIAQASFDKHRQWRQERLEDWTSVKASLAGLETRPIAEPPNYGPAFERITISLEKLHAKLDPAPHFPETTDQEGRLSAAAIEAIVRRVAEQLNLVRLGGETPPPQTTTTVVLPYEDVLFGVRKSRVSDSYGRMLDGIAASIAGSGATPPLLVIGHADEIHFKERVKGAAEYRLNFRLSRERARKVAERLANTYRGNEIAYIGAGSTRKKTDNVSGTGSIRNRRVELVRCAPPIEACIAEQTEKLKAGYNSSFRSIPMQVRWFRRSVSGDDRPGGTFVLPANEDIAEVSQ